MQQLQIHTQYWVLRPDTVSIQCVLGRYLAMDGWTNEQMDRYIDHTSIPSPSKW